MPTRVAIYCRKSTEQERQQSITSQRRSCDDYAKRQGWQVTDTYVDEAITGRSKNRPAYLRMLDDAAASEFDVLLVNDLSRLGRDEIETKLVIRRLIFGGVRIVGINDGYDTNSKSHKVQATIRGLINDIYIDNLGEDVHRTLKQRATDGYSAGGVVFGYDLVKTEHGSRYQINDKARWVVWIFERYAEGWSTRRIAGELNRMGVKSARGKTWTFTAIYGDLKRKTGFLCNELYVGRLIWNRRRWLRHPDTDARVPQSRPESEWTITDLPELRIVDQGIWDRVQDRLRRNREATDERQRETKHRRVGPGRDGGYVLSGLLKCGQCGANYTMVNGREYGCARHRNGSGYACSNSAKVKREWAEQRIMEAVRDELFSRPGEIERFEDTLRRELATTGKNAPAEIVELRKQERHVERERDNVLAAIRAGIFTESTKDELLKIEGDLKAIRQRIENLEASTKVVKLTPRLLDRRDSALASLQELATNDVQLARRHLNSLLGGVVLLYPTPGNIVAELRGSLLGLLSVIDEFGKARFLVDRTAGRYDAKRATEFGLLVARLRALIQNDETPSDLDGVFRRAKKLVAGVGFEPTTFRL